MISQARGAEIYAEFVGGSFTCDAYHVTEPHPEGNSRKVLVPNLLCFTSSETHQANNVLFSSVMACDFYVKLSNISSGQI